MIFTFSTAWSSNVLTASYRNLFVCLSILVLVMGEYY